MSGRSAKIASVPVLGMFKEFIYCPEFSSPIG